MKTVIVTVVFVLSVVSSAYATKAVFNTDTVELGVFDEGRDVERTFVIRNITDRPIRILKIEPSCGCTEVRPQRAYLPPHKSLRLTVVMDTRGKIGRVFKTLDIYTDQRDSPYSLRLIAFVRHVQGKRVDKSAVFKGPCRRCHLDSDITNRYGEELYNAVCYVCHKGPENLRPLPSGLLEKTIATGEPDTSMPAFSQSSGGPLRDDQIESLVEFIQSLKTQK